MFLQPKALLFLTMLWSTRATTATETVSGLPSADASFDLILENELLMMSSSSSPADIKKMKALQVDFVAWKDRHSKVYRSGAEEYHRFMIYRDNHDFIEAHNAKTPKPSYRLGHNEFSDHTNDEFQKIHALGRYSPNSHQAMDEKMKQLREHNALLQEQNDGHVLATQQELAYLRNLSAKSEGEEDDDGASGDTDDDGDDAAATDDNDTTGLPDAIDWVDAGAVTPVKNQGQCGSCWAFSSIGAIEGAHFIATSELISLSEQNLMDCDKIDHSCEGGLMEHAFQFEESQNGVCTEDAYPYQGVDEQECKTDCDKVEHTKVKGYTDIAKGDKHALLASLTIQPTSIAMQAGSTTFQFYSEGVIDDDSCGENGFINHGVLAVGYGFDEESGHKFFKVKNSWGDTWGDGGYFRVMRESENQYGTCAVLAYMTAPILDV